MYKDMEDLVGKKILNIFINDEKDVLFFITEQGNLIYHASGDCCSKSWIEHLDGLSSLIGGTVNEIEEVYGDVTEIEYETIKTYFYKIKTDKGRVTIDMRNSSNGYYGGNLELLGEDSYYLSKSSHAKKELKEDF